MLQKISQSLQLPIAMRQIVLNLWLAASPAKAGAVLNDDAHPHRGWLVKFAPATLGYIASQTASNIEAS